MAKQNNNCFLYCILFTLLLSVTKAAVLVDRNPKTYRSPPSRWLCKLQQREGGDEIIRSDAREEGLGSQGDQGAVGVVIAPHDSISEEEGSESEQGGEQEEGWVATGGSSDGDDSEDDNSEGTDSEGSGGGVAEAEELYDEEVTSSEDIESTEALADDLSADFGLLKSIWRSRISQPPPPAKIQELLDETQVIQKELLLTWPSDDSLTAGSAGGGGAMVYKLLLSELLAKGGGGLGGRWIDSDTLEQLRGTAALAQHPEYLKHTTGLPKTSRGLRLVSPSCTHNMQEGMAKAVAHASGAGLLVLDERALSEVRKAAAMGVGQEKSRGLFGFTGRAPVEANVPKSGVTGLTTVRLISALLAAAADEDIPLVVFLRNKGTAVLRSAGACTRLAAELASTTSRTLFLLSTASDQASKSSNNLPQVPGGVGTQNWGQAGGQSIGHNPFMSQAPGAPGKGPDSMKLIFMNPQAQSQPQKQVDPSLPGQQQDASPENEANPFPPPHIMQKLIKDALQNMQQDLGQGEDKGLPPGLSEMLGEVLDSEEGKKMLETMSKQGASNGGPQSIQIILQKHTPGQEGPPGQALPQGSPLPGRLPSPNMNNQNANEGPGSLSSFVAGLRRTLGRDNSASSGGGSDTGYGGAAGAFNMPGGPAGFAGVGEGPPSDFEHRSVLSAFVDVLIAPPPDAALKRHWDRWVADDVGYLNARRNKQALQSALSVGNLACSDLDKLQPLLAKHRLTEEETGFVVLAALKIEICRHVAAARLQAPGTQTSQNTSTSTHQKFGSGKINTNTHDKDTRDDVHDTETSPYVDRQGRLVLSKGSMERAFASVCKAYVARPGQPMSRTREEVTALAQADRHEAALVSNVILPKDIGVTYSMIGGLKEAKELLRQCVTYPLKFPHLYTEGIAREAVKGVLLFGPPGTGKTMLAKAVATEGGATFLSVDASVIENKWLGESEKNARAVFNLARRLAPCVIYLDEVDSVLSSREKYDDTTHGTLTSVKTTIMQEWDGLRTTGDRVVVIASTNRPFDLDEAVLRRLPRRIMVDLPDLETREEILRVTMAGNRMDPTVDFTQIAATLEGFTGSDIKEVCREAVVRIAHEKAQALENSPLGEADLTEKLRCVTAEDFQAARKRLTASVSEKGRELARVWEWNEEYGEIKKAAPVQHNLAMYL